MRYNKLQIENVNDLIFGTAKYPVKAARDIVIGGGEVIPELNFTLPPMKVEKGSYDKVYKEYRNIITNALERADQLHLGKVIFEFETLLEMTMDPALGTEIVKIMNDICEDFYRKKGVQSDIRLTPNDSRDFDRPPLMRSGSHNVEMFELFEKGALAGGNLLSIESTGGKELHDDALMNCNVKEVVFALAVLGVRDMKYIWSSIVKIAQKTGKIAAGDTACGFGNTAMVLAEKSYIPKVFAAFDRIATIVRSLVAYEEGAQGPGKDCGYENPFLKAITGFPMSMEGKTAACAHLSPVGNIPAATCDLWSNESVQNVKLLGGMAPTVSLEQLAYDTRLFNQAKKGGNGTAKAFQKLLVESDTSYDPQALILSPENIIKISSEIISGENYIDACIRGSLKGLEIIEEAAKSGVLKLEERENVWIDMIRTELSSIPTDESKFIDEMKPSLDESKVILKEYGI